MDVPYIKLLQEILVRGVDNGEFRKLDPNHVSLMIAGMLDSLVFVLPEFMHLPGPLENQAMERELREFLLAAILKRSESVEQRINSLCRIGGPELKS